MRNRFLEKTRHIHRTSSRKCFKTGRAMLSSVADDSWKVAAALAILLIAIAIIYFEYKFLMRKRSRLTEKGGSEDQAHNAIITTRAIASSLERGGLRSEEARALLRKAESARAAGDSRGAIELAARARELLLKEKQKQQKIGDLAKVPEGKTEQLTAEETIKEKLQKEIPKNYVQAKFMLGYAQKAIEEGGRDGRSVAEANRLLVMAHRCFDDRDYDSSLKYGVQARRAAEEIVIEVKGPEVVSEAAVTVETTVRSCKSCGSVLRMDDMFCRKCGVKVELAICPSCGTKPREGDTFCRKCGVALG